METHDVLIVGAGLAGLYMLHKCRQFGVSSLVVDAGSDVKELLASGTVQVNGESETRRGRQLHRGDVIDIGGATLTIV